MSGNSQQTESVPAGGPHPAPGRVAPFAGEGWGGGIVKESRTHSKKLRTEGLVKSYRKRRVVDGVNVNVGPGEIVGLLGPNGAGKTTTFHMMTGLVKPDAGGIWLDSTEITRLPIHRRAQYGLLYLPQEPSVFRKMSVAENILATLEILPLNSRKRREKLYSVMDEFRITHLEDKKAMVLSGGERRRVEIARAFALEPLFFLLDEPFSGIDPITVGEIQQLIKYIASKGVGIILSDHNVRDTLEVCDRAYLIHQGKILEDGPPSRIAASEAAKQFYLGPTFRF
ncbi:MAG: LPS export ABC transporter ATP-binding protein [Nitrospirae bacterium]|nr:LPS export ABC transporter ATP-binding protein [Nitrospirota bacterium]